MADYGVWTDETFELRADGTPFPRHHPGLKIEVEAGGGSVSIQTRGSADTWRDVPGLVWTADAAQIVEVAGLQPLQVVAAGGAKYRISVGDA